MVSVPVQVMIVQRCHAFGLYMWKQRVGLEDSASLATVGAFNSPLNVPPSMMGFLGIKFSHIFLLRFLDCCFEVFPLLSTSFASRHRRCFLQCSSEFLLPCCM